MQLLDSPQRVSKFLPNLMKTFSPLITLLVFLVTNPTWAEETVSFTKDIRPLLSDKCYRCHGPDGQTRQADLRLDLLTALLHADPQQGVIVPGNPAASELMVRLRSSDSDHRMPPEDSGISISEDQIQLIARWIRQGATHQSHWSFEPVSRPPTPKVPPQSRTFNPIDAFALARLRKEGLSESPPADPRTLIRRVTLDLTGLPPTPQDVATYLNNSRPTAYQELVDRLLASPRYGEHMAVPWLEASRYSDTNGYQHDFYRTVYPWRTWVIRALNANQPFDQFVLEQLAGDLLPAATDEQILATCFLRLHRLNSENGGIEEEFYVENVVDRVETISTALMGLTIGCARCHDHKFDPISMRDFYAIFAFFNNGEDKGTDSRALHAHPYSEPVIRYLDVEQRPTLILLQQRLAKLKQETTSPLVESIETQIANLRQAAPAVMIMKERTQKRPAYLLQRGAYDQRGDQVNPGIPSVFGPVDKQPNTRLEFARWLVSADNPLLTRVMVNRFWQSLFGIGLVRTTENFGAQGEPPSHPNLLDWLARTFLDNGFNAKSIHRTMVTSATYQQTSHTTSDQLVKDPENRLLARGPRFRISGFAIRDQALQASGLLVQQIGGRSVRPYQPANMWAEVSGDQKLSPAVQTTFYKMDQGAALYRRSVYTFWKLSVPPPRLFTFDSPNREICNVRRSATNTPLQALVLLNDPTFLEAARHLAASMMIDGGDSDQERIAFGMQSMLSRLPTPDEMAVLTQALQFHRAVYAQNQPLAEAVLSHGQTPLTDKIPDRSEHAALTQLALTLLNMDETITKQ